MPSLIPSRSTSQHWLLALGLVTTLSGVAHVIVWLAAGQPSLVGPVTWRKPIVFGLSIGVLAFSLVWIVRLLPDTPSLTRQARWLTGLLLLELSLIDLQQWRGVGSHFNVATTLDAAIFQAMGVIILAASGILAWWTWRLFRAPRRDQPREQLTAARAGMVLLGLGNLLGITLVVWGNTMLARTGAVPATLGAAGDLKLTHAIALHGLQVLPIVALVVAAVPEVGRRVGLVRLAAAGHLSLLGVALGQALQGRAPGDLSPAVATVAAVALSALLIPVVAGLRARQRRRRDEALGASMGGV